MEEIGVGTTPDQGHDKHRDEEDRYSSVTASKTQEPPVIKKLSNGMQLRPRASPNSSQTQEAIRIKSSPHSGSKHERKLKPPPSKQIKVSALPFYSVLLFIMNNNNNNQQDPDAILRSFISLLEAATYREHRRGPLGDGPAVLPDPRYLNSSRLKFSRGAAIYLPAGPSGHIIFSNYDVVFSNCMEGGVYSFVIFLLGCYFVTFKVLSLTIKIQFPVPCWLLFCYV